MTGMSSGSARMRKARSSASAGMARISAGPPARNQTIGASGWSGCSEPRKPARLFSQAVEKMLGMLEQRARIPSPIGRRWLRSGRMRGAHEQSGRRPGDAGSPHPSRFAGTLSLWERDDARRLSSAQLTPLLVQLRKRLRQRIRPFGDRAGAEADDHVAGLGDRGDERRQRLLALERARVAMAAGAQALDQRIAAGAFDRRLAGRIDVGDDAPCRPR